MAINERNPARVFYQFAIAIFCLLIYCGRLSGQSGLNNISCDTWLKTTGTPDAVEIGDLDITGNKITVEALINRTVPYSPANDYRYSGDIVSKHMDPGDCNYLLRVGHAEITTANGFFATPAICNFTINKTYHVAFVYDGTTLKFYRNGFLMSEVAATGNLITNDWLTKIGDVAGPWTPPSTNFIGYINEVRIWNVARTQAEIRANMAIALPNPTTQVGLQAYYNFSSLTNRQGNASWNGILKGVASINQTNSSCSYVADSCEIPTSTNACLKILQATYGGPNSDVAYDIVAAGNGMFYMVGNTNSYGAGQNDILVIKMDSGKNIIWSNTYGLSKDETIRKASSSADGGLLITGQTKSFSHTSGDILCLKIMPGGGVEWVRVFGVGSPNGDLGSDIIQTKDGGYAIAGILNVAGMVADAIVLKLDLNGNLVWNRRFDSNDGEDGSSVIEVGNKLVTTVDIQNQVGNNYGMAIIELRTSNGDFLSSQKITSSSKGIFRPIIFKDFGNGYWISGHLISGSSYGEMEQIILKLDDTYAIDKVYKLVKNPYTNSTVTGFVPLQGGGFITCASESTANGKGHIYKINAQGQIIFSKQIKTSGKAALNALSLLNDRIITVGSDNSSGSNDFFLAEFDSSGSNNNLCNIDTSIVSIQSHPFTISNYTWTNISSPVFTNSNQNLSVAAQIVNSNIVCKIQTCLLPLKLKNFSVRSNEQYNTLYFETIGEQNGATVILQRAANDLKFSDVSGIALTASRQYSIQDKMTDSEGRYIYYRLKIVDPSGDVTYSEILKVNLLIQEKKIKIWRGQGYTIMASSTKNEEVSLSLFDISGKLLLRKKVFLSIGQNKLLEQSLPNGIYFLSLQSKTESAGLLIKLD